MPPGAGCRIQHSGCSVGLPLPRQQQRSLSLPAWPLQRGCPGSRDGEIRAEVAPRWPARMMPNGRTDADGRMTEPEGTDDRLPTAQSQRSWHQSSAPVRDTGHSAHTHQSLHPAPDRLAEAALRQGPIGQMVSNSTSPECLDRNRRRHTQELPAPSEPVAVTSHRLASSKPL